VRFKGHWKDPKNQRAFLEEIRKKLNVDDMEKWYSVPVTKVLQNGGYGMLFRHRYSLPKGK
jgi:hypothetical protein